MKLLLHIFRKDVRHFFPEILINLALLIAFAWATPYTWQGPSWSGLQPVAAALLRLLIPLGWLVMISRVLHDEALVGDRQFWVTRPYTWPSLLAAKLCFLLVFLHLPLLLMQAYLVHHAGFAIAPVLGRLLHFQAFTAAVYVLPLMAFTVVTASFGRQILTVLAGLIYVALVFAGTESLMHANMTAPYLDWIAVTLVLLVLLAVIFLMYARRFTWPARVALLVLPVAVALLALSLPTSLLVRRVYASAGSGNVLQFDVDPGHRQPLAGSGDPVDDSRNVLIQIPVQLHTTGGTHEATVAGVQFTLRAADGIFWTSHFQASSTALALDQPELLRLRLPVDVYQQLQGRPTEVQMEAAVESFTFPAPETLTIPPDGSFVLANGGHCTPSPTTDFLQCRYALQVAPPLALSLTLQAEPCTEIGQREVIHRRTDGATRGRSMDLDPISVQTTPLFHEDEETRVVTDRQLCPGAQASFATEQSLGRSRLFLTTPPLLLPSYAVPRHPSVFSRRH